MFPMTDAQAALSNMLIQKTTAEATLCFPQELPVFAGHFPQYPLVPGVHQLAAMVCLASACLKKPLRLQSISRCKWSAQLLPDQQAQLTITCTQQDDRYGITGTVSLEGTVTTKASLVVLEECAGDTPLSKNPAEL